MDHIGRSTRRVGDDPARSVDECEQLGISGTTASPGKLLRLKHKSSGASAFRVKRQRWVCISH